MRILLALFLSFSLALALDIKVGSENAYPPFAYLDENNKPTGFDNEVVQILASYVPNAKLEVVSLSWNAIFSGLDSAKFDVVANQITKTKEREEKYLFSNQPYFYDISTLISLEDNKIADISELKNSKIGVTIGSNHAKNLEEYLEKHPELNIQIIYYKTSPSLVADLKNNRINAMVNNPIAASDYAKAQNITLHTSKFHFQKVPVFLLFRKESENLKGVLDEALEKALKEGKISQLSLKYFGVDLSK